MKKFEDLTEEEFDILNSNGLLHSIYPEALEKFIKPDKIKKDTDFYNKKKELLISFIPDCLTDLFYYDRKECEEISADEVTYLFENNLISKKELIEAFSKAINDCFN